MFWKLNDYFPTREYDTHQAYSYGYNRFISEEGRLVWWGKNTSYVGKMHNKKSLRSILHLSSILSGSKILWSIDQTAFVLMVHDSHTFERKWFII